MTPYRPTVVIGILGLRLDAGQTEERWTRWRPTVSLCQHEDLAIDRLELLHLPSERELAAVVVGDIGTVSPETIVTCHEIDVADPWDFEEVFASLHGFARSLAFRTDDEDYLVHITTGTHVQQICSSARPIAASCSSTKSGSSASTNRRCSSGRSRSGDFSRSARMPRWPATSNSWPARTPIFLQP